MDDEGEAADLSEHEFGTNNIHISGESVDSFLDEFLRSAQTCTHTHTCNPPAPDAAAPHTHTCYHSHTQIIPPSKPKRRTTTTTKTTTTGNREAVRKYREKKKAHTAYLEEEVKKLRLVNQQLIRKVQRQAVLETEISRLRGLFLDLRRKIDAELGVFPFQKHCNSSTNLKGGNCGIPCSSGTGTVMMEMRCQDDDLLCFHHPYTSSVERKCIPAIVACPNNPDVAGNVGAETCGIESVETMVSSASQAQ